MTNWNPQPNENYRAEQRTDYHAGYSDAFYGKFGDGIVEPTEAYRTGFTNGVTDTKSPIALDSPSVV